MAVFEKVAPLIIAIEGEKEVNDSSDYGGETKYGISKRQYPDLEINALTEQDAVDILKRDYWKKYSLDQIDNQGIANQVFFLFINMNPLHVGLVVQAAINACGRGIVTVKPDGIMGSITIRAVNALADGWLSNRIRLEAISYYLQLTDHDASQIVNFRGWVRRALRQ
jgi:lysozyme family protein